MLHIRAKQEYLNSHNKPNISTCVQYVLSHIISCLISILVQMNLFWLLGIKDLNVFHVPVLEEHLDLRDETICSAGPGTNCNGPADTNICSGRWSLTTVC